MMSSVKKNNLCIIGMFHNAVRHALRTGSY